MKAILILLILTAVVVFYALYGREWLKTKTWGARFLAWIEPVEIFLFKKSTTILFARFKQLMGVTVTFLISIGQIDLTTIAPFIPEKYRWLLSLAPLGLNVLGMIDEALRNRQTKPIELVALPDKAVTPEIAQAVATAEIAKVEAVAVVKAETEKAA